MAKRLAKKFKVTVTIPEGKVAGDTLELEVETPIIESEGRRGGQLAGIALADMTDEQLKREIINAGSVLYKARQKTDDPAIIEPKAARVEAAKAEKAKRAPAKAEAEAVVEDNGEIDEDTAAEV